VKLTILTRDLTETETDDWETVSVQVVEGAVFVQIGNGGDFGPTEWGLTPKDAERLADTILNACHAVREQQEQ
jgi:hypothetical protein